MSLRRWKLLSEILLIWRLRLVNRKNFTGVLYPRMAAGNPDARLRGKKCCAGVDTMVTYFR